MEIQKPKLITRLCWFVAYWLGSLLVLSVVAYGIRWAVR